MSDAVAPDPNAIRYIVLRKLASGFRHALMGELQGIQFLATVGARLMNDGTDASRMRDCVGKIPAATGEAIATCRSLLEWMRPDAGAVTTLGDVVGECVKLAGDDWRIRGIRASFEMPEPARQARVSKAGARELIVTSLLALTDQQPGALDIDIVAALDSGGVELRLQGRLSSRSAAFAGSAPYYHTLGWDDVAALADANAEFCACGHGFATFRFSLAPPAAESSEAGAGPDAP